MNNPELKVAIYPIISNLMILISEFCHEMEYRHRFFSAHWYWYYASRKIASQSVC